MNRRDTFKFLKNRFIQESNSRMKRIKGVILPVGPKIKQCAICGTQINGNDASAVHEHFKTNHPEILI